jgi:Protein of unknown function (DUF2829)
VGFDSLQDCGEGCRHARLWLWSCTPEEAGQHRLAALEENMNFSEALVALKEGKRVYREIWNTERLFLSRLTVELVQPLPLPDGREFTPQLVVFDGKLLRPFSGANWDILEEDDWRIAEE